MEQRTHVADPPIHHHQMRVMGRTTPLAQLARVTPRYSRGEPPKLLHTYIMSSPLALQLSAAHARAI
jgi:hypothetical protein